MSSLGNEIFAPKILEEILEEGVSTAIFVYEGEQYSVNSKQSEPLSPLYPLDPLDPSDDCGGGGNQYGVSDDYNQQELQHNIHTLFSNESEWPSLSSKYYLNKPNRTGDGLRVLVCIH